MSWQGYLLIATGLFFWIAVAVLLLVSLHKTWPAELIDWRDQLAMALWPVAVPLVFIHDIITRHRRPQNPDKKP